jgi:hypothetical protein
LTLHPTRYEWQFVPIAGRTFTDAGSANCVGSSDPTQHLWVPRYQTTRQWPHPLRLPSLPSLGQKGIERSQWADVVGKRWK